MQKFETPILRLVTTADGPVCFDIAKESTQINEKGDLIYTVVREHMGSTGPNCVCQCTCECTSPCNCQCTCECRVPCTCECTCECESKSDQSCGALSVENDPLVEIINPIEKTGEKIKLNDAFMFRKENFGGIVFDKQYFVTYYCNHSAWEIFEFIKKHDGLLLKDIKLIPEHLRRTFEKVPEELNAITYAFVHGCMKKSSRIVRK